MHPSITSRASSLGFILLIGACSPNTVPSPSVTSTGPASTVAPSTATGPTASPSSPSRPAATASPSPDTFASGTLGPDAAFTPQPFGPPTILSNSLPIHGSARDMAVAIAMVPGPDGSLLVSIPTTGGHVLAVLDSGGQLRDGWPVVIKDVDECRLPTVMTIDGSVWAICDVPRTDGGGPSVARGFSFDQDGDLTPGWPTTLDAPPVAGRQLGYQVLYLASWPLTDHDDGTPNSAAGIINLSTQGFTQSFAQVPTFEICCRSTMGPDGIAYIVSGVSGPDVGSEEVSRITAIDSIRELPGWPVRIDGTPSGPVIDPDGRIVLADSSLVRKTTRVLKFDSTGKTVDTSAELPIETATYAEAGGCRPYVPQSPLVGQDGTVFVFSELHPSIFALTPSLAVRTGWPFRPARPLVMRDERYVKEDAYCPTLAIPAVGPDSTIYLPLQASGAGVGGSLVAVGRGGKVVPGWPVELSRPGAEFWSVAAGSDGMVYALAVEPESSRTSSASILAIAPDGTVRGTTTIIDP